MEAAKTNLFGDIASDQASGLAGGVAVAPSLNPGTDQAMAQAVHDTAPDIEGKNIAHPTALALSTAMLLRWFDQKKRDQRCRDTAGLIERGIHGAMQAGTLTRDLGGRASATDFTRGSSTRSRIRRRLRVSVQVRTDPTRYTSQSPFFRGASPCRDA